jgi:hypothetical protein
LGCQPQIVVVPVGDGASRRAASRLACKQTSVIAETEGESGWSREPGQPTGGVIVGVTRPRENSKSLKRPAWSYVVCAL